MGGGASTPGPGPRSHPTPGAMSAADSPSVTAAALHCAPSPGTDVVLTVIWCGTSGQLFPPTTQIGVFASLCQARDITRGMPALESMGIGTRSRGPEADGAASSAVERASPVHLKIAFDGCGVTFGGRGAIFAHGLKQQNAIVLERLEALLAAGAAVRLNLLGLSRGGMAVLLLLKKLPSTAKAPNLDVCSLVFDPVPGNSILSSTWLDCITRQTLANQCLFVSGVQLNWTRHLAIYPHEPLPDLAFHAPILPSYPQAPGRAPAVLVEDAALGCHQGALWGLADGLDSCCSFVRIHRFLTECGTLLSVDSTHKYIQDQYPIRPLERAVAASRETGARDGGAGVGAIKTVRDMERACLTAMDQAVEGVGRPRSTVRHAHAWRAATIECHHEGGAYLNRHHVELARIYGGDADAGGAVRAGYGAIDGSIGAAGGGPVSPLAEVVVPESELILRVNRSATRLAWAARTLLFFGVVGTIVAVAMLV